jgi:DNA-binding beta-propeller fold protein YncE
MAPHQYVFRQLTCLAVALTVAGGASRSLIQAQVRDLDHHTPPRTATVIPAWPAAPARPLVRFVRSLDPAASRGRPSFIARAWRALVGGADEPGMQQPYGIAVDAAGRVLVADTTARTIHVLDTQKRGYSAIAVDGDSLIGVARIGSRLFVTDSASGRLICIDERGRTRWTLGPRDGLQRPTGLAAATDRIMVADTLGHRIVTVSVEGTIISSFGQRGRDDGEFNFPTNVARRPDGRLLVTDSMNFRVQEFDADGRFIQAFGRLGDRPGEFDKPKGLATDRDGHVYVVDGMTDVVQMFDEHGVFVLAFGGSGAGAGQLWLPTGIAIVNSLIYVSDAANRRIQVFEYLGGRS